MDINKLYELYNKLAENHGKDSEEAVTLREILLAEENTTPKGGIRMTDYIGTGANMQRRLTGVYYDRGNIVASDMSILITVKGDYPAGLEGKIIGRNGAVIDDKFPDWEKVIPDAAKMTEFTPDWDAVAAGYAEAKFAKRAKTNLKPSVNFGAFKLNYKNAGRLLELRKKPGITSVFYTSESRPVLVEGVGFRVVVMPVM